MDLKPYLVKSSRSLKGSSINNYVRNIKTLHGGEPFEDLNWLTDTAALLQCAFPFCFSPVFLSKMTPAFN